MMKQRIENFIETHDTKVLALAPVVFLSLLGAVGIAAQGNVLLLRADRGAFVSVGETISVALDMYAKTPINAAGGIISFPPELLEIESLSRETSAIDLWSEEPAQHTARGEILFSGGFINTDDAPTLHGTILVVHFKTTARGKAQLLIKNGELLAADGVGTNVLSGANTLTLYVRDAGAPSPDINDDGILSSGDATTLYLSIFRTYDARRDLNRDGKVSFDDVRQLISLF